VRIARAGGVSRDLLRGDAHAPSIPGNVSGNHHCTAAAKRHAGTLAVVTRAATIALAGLALAALAGCAGAGHAAGGPTARRAADRWRPAPRTVAWQWQLQGRLDPAFAASVYDVDGFGTSAAGVRALHRRGRRAVCYLDVGSWESFRPDAAEFPRSVIGRRYAGFPDERWLDVGRFRLFAAPLRQRIAMCARKGFDAVEPDNLNGWEAGNRTGFAITRADQLRFNRWIARQVHARGMAVGLKNDGRQARALVGQFDFAVVEQCFQFHECGYYLPFVRHGKAVFEAEYELRPAAFCGRARALGFSAIGKSYSLLARPWMPCEPS
jgi:hypothetical protein